MMNLKDGKSAFGNLFGGKNYQYTRLDAQVQNVKNSKVYVFSENDIVEEDDEVVEYEMDSIRPRKGRNLQGKPGKDEGPSYVERRITEDDSLLSLSLQYGCPVAELKRVNNLISDQDFYALTRVKIPVKQYSFLIDQIKDEEASLSEQANSREAERSNGAACFDSGEDVVFGYESEPDLTTDLSDPETQRHVIRKISINSATKSQSREAREFLRSMDKDLSKIMSTRRTDRNSLDEVISVLTNKSVHPLGNSDMIRQKKNSEWSLKWRTSVILLIIVAIVTPLLFGLHLVFSGRN